MNKIVTDRRPFVLVFVPYTDLDGRLVSPWYDEPHVRADVGRWMASLGLQWEWCEVAASNLAQHIDRAREMMGMGNVVVFNLCDGDDDNGQPGLTVVKALESANIPFTGARSRFYEISTSKIAMKRRFVTNNVRTAPYLRIRQPRIDIARAGEVMGYPIFIKPDVSAAAAGLTPNSKANGYEEGVTAAQALLRGMHGLNFRKAGILAERFLAGREFTVLVLRDRSAPMGVRVIAPVERVFDTAIPAEQRFLTYARVTGEGEGMEPGTTPETYAYTYAAAPAEFHAELADISRRAFLAVEGTGYARVDIRFCAETQAPFVLEVNANCGLSTDETSSVGAILQLSGTSVGELMGWIVGDALSRFRRKRLEAMAA